MKKLILICLSLALHGGLIVNAQEADEKKGEVKLVELKDRLGNITINTQNLTIITADTKSEEKADQGVTGKSDSKSSTNILKIEPTGSIAALKSAVLRQWETIKSWSGFEIWKILTFCGGFILTLVIARIVRWFVEYFINKHLAEKTNTHVDNLICEAAGKPSSLLIVSIGLFLSSLPMTLAMSPGMFDLIGRLFLALGASAVAWGIYRMIVPINYMLEKFAERTDNNLDDLIVAIVRKSLKVTILVVSLLFIGQNILGLNITTILAGAGVFGLAIAFAAKDTIANFFGSIMIILDQPFKVGERIEVNGTSGTVENVGFRSSRLRTLTGHLVTIPNNDIANNTIENIGKRPFIKHSMDIGLVYETPKVKMDRAIEILHEIVDDHEGMNKECPPRIVFNAFKDWSLNISITVWYHTFDENGDLIAPDYGMYVVWCHQTNMEILRRFNEEGLEFAFPTNTTYLAYDKSRKLEFDIKNK